MKHQKAARAIAAWSWYGSNREEKMKLHRMMILANAVLLVMPARAQNAEDILQRTRAMYVSLRSYSDTGVVLSEYGSSSQDRHTFTTYFNRNPRHFILDFRKQGGGQYVIWGDPDAFHTWWMTTGQQYDYPNPNNVNAISMSSQNTGSSALKIPTLLYGKSSLAAALLNISDPVLDGTEEVAGRRCYRLMGRVSDLYAATGKEVNIHKITVCIDTELLLIRKVLEEWKALPGQRSRLITTYEPRANPALEDARFKFVPPEPK
jgi:outer membrane lipoprotein-sorting protein